MSRWFKIKKFILTPFLWLLGATDPSSEEVKHLNAKKWIRTIKNRSEEGDVIAEDLVRELKFHLNRK